MNLAEGYKLFKDCKIALTLNDTKIHDVGVHCGSGGKIRPINQQDLDLPFVTIDEIKLNLLDVVEQDGTTISVIVKASNKRCVTVEDVLKAFLENNKKWLSVAPRDENGKESPIVGHVYFEGVEQEAPDEFSFVSFGS